MVVVSGVTEKAGGPYVCVWRPMKMENRVGAIKTREVKL